MLCYYDNRNHFGEKILIDSSFLFDAARNLYGELSHIKNSGEAFIPIRYAFEITYRCNLRCPYCYVGEHSSSYEMSTQEIIDIIKQIPPFGFITLVGGEPLIRQDFLEIFEHASKQTLGKTNLITNGSLLTEEISESLIKNKLLLLSVSLDGYGKNHDINRQKEGLFEKVTGNLEVFNSKRGKNPLVDIKTVILENNLDDLPLLYKYAKDMGFDFLSLAFKRNNMLKQNSCLKDTFGEEFYKEEYPIEPYFDMEHFKEVYKELMSLSKNSKTLLRWAPKFKPRGDFSKIEDFFSKGNTPVQEIYKKCVFPYSNIFINPEGDVFPCLSVKVGNIRGKKIKDVFNSPEYICFRKKLKASKLFNSCQMCCELVPKNL